MAIMPIDEIPESSDDKRKTLRDKLMNDVLQIIKQQIPLCEITSGYRDSTMRAGLQTAIRRAVYRWNQKHIQDLSYDDLIIHRRKEDDGSVHWYIEFKGVKVDNGSENED